MLPKLDPENELDAAIIAHRGDFRRVAGFSLVSNMLMLVPALYMLQVYDRVLNSRNSTTLIMLTLILLVLLALQGALESARGRLLQRVGVGLDQLLGARVFEAILRRNLRAPEGNAIQPLHDLTTLRQFLGGPGVASLFDAPWAPIYLVVIALIHPWLGLFALASAIVILGLALLNEAVSSKPLLEAQQWSMKAGALAGGQLRNAEVAEALGMVDMVRARWSELQDKVLALQSLASERAGKVGKITRFVRLATQSLILGLGALLAIEDVITPGGMIAGSILLGRALAPVEQLIAQWRAWLSARTAHGRLRTLLKDYPAPPKSMPLPAPSGMVTVENVTAAPPGRQVVVLKGLTFQINPGDAVGIVGPSAAGKSSLARLLVGLWRPLNGHVRLDSVNAADWDKTELGPYLGYLPQDVELFEGTVAENIARFGTIDAEQVVAAARRAGVHDMILRLPAGYETRLGGGGGVVLSSGQTQRIGLARALHGNPRLVVLDEPNANLDDAGEAALLEALRGLKSNGATVVVVTHRSSVLAVLDKLLVLREGQLAYYGPRDLVLEALHKEGAR